MHFYLNNLSVSKNYCIVFSGFIKHIVAFPLDCVKEKNCGKEIFLVIILFFELFIFDKC